MLSSCSFANSVHKGLPFYVYQHEYFVSCYIMLTGPEMLYNVSSPDRGGGVIIRMWYGGVCVTIFYVEGIRNCPCEVYLLFYDSLYFLLLTIPSKLTEAVLHVTGDWYVLAFRPDQDTDLSWIWGFLNFFSISPYMLGWNVMVGCVCFLPLNS